MADADTLPASPTRVFAVVPIALLVAVAARMLDPSPRVAWSTFLGFAAGSAALVGVPVTHWLLETGRTSVRAWMIVGALAGMLPLCLALLSGAFGQLVWSGEVAYLLEYVSRRAPFPLVGAVQWSAFSLMLLEGAFVGACSGVVYRQLSVRR
jgi:hypothetical protein